MRMENIEMRTKEWTQDVYVENPNREKPREPTDSELSLWRQGVQSETRRHRPWARFLRQPAITTEYRSVSLSPSLSLSSVQQLQQYDDYNLITYKVIALSHIYTYMNLGLFTNIASIGLLKTYLQICLLHSVLTGSSMSGSQDPIRRDRNPNNIELHKNRIFY